MLQGVGCTFHSRPYKVPFRLAEINTIIHSFGIRIPDRSPLTGHIRKKDQPVTSRINACCLLIKKIKRTFSLSLSLFSLISTEFFLQPSHHSAASGRAPLEEPVTRDDMISKDQPLIRLICIGADTHSAGLSALLLSLSAVDNARSERTACRIQTACCHRCSRRQSTLCRRLFGHSPDNVMACMYFRQYIRRESESRTHFFIPASFSHIETVQPVSL